MGWNGNHDSPSTVERERERERHLLQLVQPLSVLMELSGKMHSESMEAGKQQNHSLAPSPCPTKKKRKKPQQFSP